MIPIIESKDDKIYGEWKLLDYHIRLRASPLRYEVYSSDDMKLFESSTLVKAHEGIVSILARTMGIANARQIISRAHLEFISKREN